MKKFKLIGCIISLVAIVGINVCTVMKSTANTIELQIEDVEYVAEGDGSYGISDWLGLCGGVFSIAHHIFCTGLEWAYLGKETDKKSDWYGVDKYRCESAFFGTAECQVAAILYGQPPN
jgi:hypothetical protein